LAGRLVLLCVLTVPSSSPIPTEATDQHPTKNRCRNKCLAKRRGCSCSKTTLERMNLATTESHLRKSGSRSSTGSLLHPFSTPHSPTPIPGLTVSGVAGTKAIS
jgi:hypothetical protein